MSFANIVHNDSPDPAIICVSGGSYPNMEYCVFDMNSGTLFKVESGILEVSHSFISHTGSISASTPVLTNDNNTFSKRSTYQIVYFSSHYCNADYTPPNTPAITQKVDENSEKPISAFIMIVGSLIVIFLISGLVYYFVILKNHHQSDHDSDSKEKVTPDI